MKNFINFIIGFSLLMIISIINFFVFAMIIRFSLPSIFSMFIVQIVISTFLFLIFKKKFIKAGVLVSSLIALIYFGNNLYKKMTYLESKSVTINTTDFEKSEKDKREDFMKDTSLTLFEKFSNMKLGKLSDSIVIAFSIKNEIKTKKSRFNINSLIIDFSDFNITTTPNDEYFLRNDNFQYLKDTLLRIVAKNGNVIVKKLEPSAKSDSLVYLGYLPKQNLFIIAQGLSEYGIDYISINSQNGQEIDGIPLFKSQNEKYYSFIYFHHFIGYLELIIKYWTLDNNNYYQLIHEEKIPFNTFLENSNCTSYDISNIGWDKTKFSFVLRYYNSLKRVDESILVESKIINMK